MSEKKKGVVKKGLDNALNMKRVSDLVDQRVEVDDFIKLRDNLPIEIIVDDIEERKGNKGDYIIVIGRDLKKGDSIGFSCGSVVIMRKLRELKESRSFPVKANFHKPEGKEYYDVE